MIIHFRKFYKQPFNLIALLIVLIMGFFLQIGFLFVALTPFLFNAPIFLFFIGVLLMVVFIFIYKDFLEDVGIIEYKRGFRSDKFR